MSYAESIVFYEDMALTRHAFYEKALRTRLAALTSQASSKALFIWTAICVATALGRADAALQRLRTFTQTHLRTSMIPNRGRRQVHPSFAPTKPVSKTFHQTLTLRIYVSLLLLLCSCLRAKRATIQFLTVTFLRIL